MGKRAFLIKQQTLAEIFEHRGPGWGAVIRVGGKLLPADAKICGFAYLAPKQAWSLCYESLEWPEETLLLPGQRADKVNGATIIDGCVCWLRIVSNIADNPLCQVTDLDGIVAVDLPLKGEGEKCEIKNDG